jgi:hypothetical protein
VRAETLGAREMPTSPSQLLRFRSAWAAGLLAAAGVGAWVALARASAERVEVDEETGIVTCRAGELRYEFRGATATEALYDLRQDRRCVFNVIAQHPEDAARFRALVQREVGAQKLASLCDRFAASRARLAALGYL